MVLWAGACVGFCLLVVLSDAGSFGSTATETSLCAFFPFFWSTLQQLQTAAIIATFIVLTLCWMYLVHILIIPFCLQILLMSTWLLGFPCRLVILPRELLAEKVTFLWMKNSRGVHSLLYFAYTCVRDLFIGGVIYLARKIIRWWYFRCKKLENIICDVILHVNMFHYFKIPYFTCTFFTKFTYVQWIYWTLFFIACCSTIFASDLRRKRCLHCDFIEFRLVQGGGRAWRSRSGAIHRYSHLNPVDVLWLRTTGCAQSCWWILYLSVA